jgi:hypothetical protein
LVKADDTRSRDTYGQKTYRQMVEECLAKSPFNTADTMRISEEHKQLWSEEGGRYLCGWRGWGGGGVEWEERSEKSVSYGGRNCWHKHSRHIADIADTAKKKSE